MMRVSIADIAEVQKSQERWNELVLAMRRPSIFCTWEWIYSWWKHFGQAYKPFILFVYQGAELVAILPLATRMMVLEDQIVPARVISLCGSLELYPDHWDIICGEEHAEAALDAIFAFIARNCTDWDILQFSHLYEESRLLEWFGKHAEIGADIQRVTVAPYIPLIGGFDDYMKRFTGKHRHNMNRLRNRLYQKYGVQFAQSDQALRREGGGDLEELFELHDARKQQTGTKSTFLSQSLLNFHAELAGRIEKNGWLRFSSLRTQDRAIAIGYGFVFGGCFSYYQSGFDPEWQRHSVGSILLLGLIENACKEGCSEFDFLRGGEDYKSAWTKTSRSLFNINLYNKTFRGAVAKVFDHVRLRIRASLSGTETNGNDY